jgi:hypothetical protein
MWLDNMHKSSSALFVKVNWTSSLAALLLPQEMRSEGTNGQEK